MRRTDDAQAIDYGRRRVLGLAAGALASAMGVGTTAYYGDQPHPDEDGDGIPDPLERSPRFDRALATVFGDEFETVDPDRKDLLVDVRCVGDAAISADSEAYLRDLFRQNGIHVQWLDYPSKYDERAVRGRYGTTVEDLLAKRNGFYWNEVEPFLRDVAFQLVVVPARFLEPHEGRIYSTFLNAYFKGMNFGNRAVVVRQDDEEDEARLVLHEVAHLALYHDFDPDNRGVMGRGDEIDLTDREWARFRNGLTNIRDTTGYDVVFRRRLWEEQLDVPALG